MRPGSTDPVGALARSGLMALTGWPDRAPILPPLGLPAALAGLTAEIERWTSALGRPVRVNWEAAVAGRAALLGLHRQGRISANGSCRLLRTSDGWVALNLPRPDDVDVLPALTGHKVTEPWRDVTSAAAGSATDPFVAQARLLGLAAAPVPTGHPSAALGSQAGLWSQVRRWAPAPARPSPTWRVVDLSSLWAGPVTARVLGEAGAQITKVESSARPDAARAIPEFYRWVHGPGEERSERLVRLDFRSQTGRSEAAALLDAADVVIEASRPRALEQLGLGPDDRPGRPGRVWLSITGYGRRAPGRDWVAFGDDAAVAGGLVGWDASREPVFCGDALADPISGLAGAVAVLGALADGGGQLIDLAMSTAAAGARGAVTDAPPAGVEVAAGGAGRWMVRAGDRVEELRDRPASLEWIESGSAAAVQSFPAP